MQVEVQTKNQYLCATGKQAFIPDLLKGWESKDIPKNFLVKVLLIARYGFTPALKRISQPTFWRWGNLASVASDQSSFSYHEGQRLILVAQGFRQKKKPKEIRQEVRSLYLQQIGAA